MKLILNSAAWAGQPVTVAGRPGSTLAGKSRTVQTWGVAPLGEGGVVVNENATMSIMAEPTDAPRIVTINGATATLDPSLYTDGPVCLIPPVIEKFVYGTTQGFRIVSRGVWSYDPDLGGVHFWDTGWYRDDTMHAKPDPEYYKSKYDTTSRIFTFREVCTQGDQTRVAISNPLQFT